MLLRINCQRIVRSRLEQADRQPSVILEHGSDKPVVGMPSPLLVQSDKAPGAYRDGTGPDAKIEIVNADGKAQVITPAFKAQDEFKDALEWVWCN